MTAYTTAATALPGCVLHLPFNEPSGATATDLKGTVGNFTYLNSPTLGNASLLPGDPTNTCVLLNGTTQRIYKDEVAAMDLTSQCGIVAWVSPTDTTTDHTLVTKGSSAYGASLRGAGVWQAAFLGASVVSPGYSAAPGSTYMAAFTYDGANSTVIVNGVQLAQSPLTGAIPVTANQFEIGSFAGGQLFKGYMQHFTLCNQAPSLDALRNLYLIGAPAQGEITGESANVFPFSRQILAANANRTRVTFTNTSDRPIDLSFSGTATVGAGVRLQVNSEPFSTTNYTGAVSAIHAGFLGAKTLAILEET